VAVLSVVEDVAVVLSGEDPDGDEVTFIVTTLPAVGLLLVDNASTGVVVGAGAAALTPITARGTTLPAGVSSVVYRPVASASRTPVTFGYTVRDSNGAYPTQGAYDALVTLQLPHDASSLAASPAAPSSAAAAAAAAAAASTPLLAGAFGYALALDGSARLVASRLTASATGSFAVEAWIKAAGGPAHRAAVVVATDGFQLLASRLAGLSLSYQSITSPELNVFTLQARKP
jgi:hypothetical protein